MRKRHFTLKWARSFSYWAPNQQAGHGWLAKRIPEVFRWTMEGRKTQWKSFVNKVSDRLMKKLFPTLPFSTTRVSVTELPFVAIIWIIYDNSTPHWIVVQLDNRSQHPLWGWTKVAVVERFKQESMYGLSAKKMTVVERWPFVEIRL